jgi:xanthine dehydrogenase large subunit
MSAPADTKLERISGGAGAAIRHDSASGHVTGRALYLDDMPVAPGTLEAALVLSPHPHARIKRIDFSKALAADGVIAAITAKDIPGKNDIAAIKTDEPLLPESVVE